MQRPLPEVLKSQDEMLRRRGNADSITDTSAIEEAFQRHLIEVNQWLAGKANMRVSRVHYHRVLREPKAVAEEIAAFLEVPLDIEAMVRQVDARPVSQSHEEVVRTGEQRVAPERDSA